MKTRILYLFTRTPLHVGAGSSVGAVDQPVQRERHTGFPIVPGSSIKGVLRDYFEADENQKAEVDKLFGKGDDGEDFTAGQISFSEAKLLAFPVRSAKGTFALATSPLALRRYARDAGLSLDVPNVEDGQCLAGEKLVFSGKNAVVLEEYRFAQKGSFPDQWVEALSSVLNDEVLKGASGRLVLLSDGDFSHFALNACQVQQHVRINPETGTAQEGALFNEETVPSETLFYGVLTLNPKVSEENIVTAKLKSETLLQFGGGASTGLGFCTTKLA
jgi:CRISPR-associated protein Cmr4